MIVFVSDEGSGVQRPSFMAIVAYTKFYSIFLQNVILPFLYLFNYKVSRWYLLTSYFAKLLLASSAVAREVSKHLYIKKWASFYFLNLHYSDIQAKRLITCDSTCVKALDTYLDLI